MFFHFSLEIAYQNSTAKKLCSKINKLKIEIENINQVLQLLKFNISNPLRFSVFCFMFYVRIIA